MEGRIGNAFACERCRKHKVRCVPSDVAGICQRCQKARVECIEHIARRRPPKHRPVLQTSSRVADLETKLESVSAMVVGTSAPQPPLPPPATMASKLSDMTQRTPTPSDVPKVSLRPNPVSTPETALAFWESINETISGMGRLDPILRTISVIHMELLVESFHRMVDYFPFVMLPRDAPVRDSILQRPVLMFAVLTVASYDSALLQFTLSREFRKIVMVKVMNGEKSLDLLQGTLVFIAWHHHYMDPHAVSMHMLLQMCIGMASDLGLDRLPSSYHRDDPRDRECKRAYLGCYYLSCSLRLMEPGKPQGLVYTPTIRKYASEVSHFRDRNSDQILPALVDTCQFLEDIDETFRNRSEQTLVARSQTKRLGEHWDAMRNSLKHLAGEYKTLQWLQLASRVYMFQQSVALELTDRDSVSWAAGFQLSLRISCLRATEQFLESCVQMSSNQYECLSIVDWVHLISSLTMLGKLAVHSPPMAGWDPSDLQLSKTFEHFRDQLCSQMPRLHDNQERRVENVFERFRRVTAMMKGAVKQTPGRSSPGSTFEITTSSRQTVSLLQDSPLPKPGGGSNGVDLPTPWKPNPHYDISSEEFTWKFLMGIL
jgi:hypothetical protein